MAIYADYTYYTSQYYGTAIASADWNRLALNASAFVDRYTYNRAAAVITAATDAATIAKIKFATCAVAEVIYRLDGSSGPVQSESVGGYSVSYFNPKTKEAQAVDAMTTFLGDTGLMFRGFTTDEKGTDQVRNYWPWWWY